MVALIVVSAWLAGLVVLIGLRLRATRPAAVRAGAERVVRAGGARRTRPRAPLRTVQDVARPPSVAPGPARAALSGRRV